jgi:hypothetical protein
MTRIVIIEESLNEFAKRGRPRKNAKKLSKKMRDIDTPDDWNDTEEEDNEEIVDDIDVDVSDMVDTENIEIEEDVFDSELIKALTNELKFPDFNRRTVRFRIKGNLAKLFQGIPVAKLGSDKPAFLFKLQNGSIKKVFLKDMILEQEKGNDRAFTINEIR